MLAGAIIQGKTRTRALKKISVSPFCRKTKNNKIIYFRYLSTGMAFRQLAFSFRISKSSVAYIVIEVCKAVWNSLQKQHMPIPNPNSFKTIAKEFYDKWNFPNCVGSLDGKHVRLKCPSQSGSMFYNYKQFYSIVLMAIVDAKYRFTMIDVVAYGKDSDAGVFTNSAIYQNLTNGNITLPENMQLPNSHVKAPFVFIGDEAFPLRTYLMRPFPRRRTQENSMASYFNYRLSRARMTVECAFGISAARFRILLKAIETKVENAVHIVKSICILHNTILDMENDLFINVSETENNIQERIPNLNVSRSNNRYPREAENIREVFSQYFFTNKI